MYSSLFKVSQWCNAVDFLGKRRKMTLISYFGEISGSRGMERNIFYLISKFVHSNPGWVITCRNDIMLIHVPHGQGSIEAFLSFGRSKSMAYFGFTPSFGNNRRRCDVHALISRGCNTSQFGPHISPIYHVRMVARCSSESTFEGHHTKVVQLGPRYGFILFIVSEVMFFFALFRASSHSSLAPTVEIGGIWPPKGIAVLDPWEIPFLNTLIPLSSGAAVTWAHHAILAGKEKRAVYVLVATVSLALVFIGFQGMGYYQAPFIISDSIYGSTFFLVTGFHGFHVIIGTIFSIICGIHHYLGHLTKEHHVGFEAAAWY
ncbi:hypothetical protein H5410_036431 [Solanum commersonii]|uniref:Cytochrome c oxidase subunit 3 n=1 Tax=Solanum commersonii TaxID=4109 RepID=A0A9J5Y5M0_SOLCO|nr:hypothetical protein H5410_036431 [Solanum commersonii]